MKRLSLSAAVLAVTVALLAGCTDPGGTSSTPSSTGGGDATGVTDDTISIAYITPDLRQIIEMGIMDAIEDPQVMVDAMVDDVNARGGINGRMIEAKVYAYDVLDIPASLNATCVDVGEDDPTFVALSSSFFGDAVTCLTADHGVPILMTGTIPREILDSTQGRAWLFNNSGDRELAGTAETLAARGALEGKVLGALWTTERGQGQSVRDGLEPALEAEGYSLTAAIEISAPNTTADPASIQAAVQQLRDAGVTGVFMTSNQFNNSAIYTEAKAQNYFPTWFASDMNEAVADNIFKTVPPEILESAEGATWRRLQTDVGDSASEEDRACREIRDRVPSLEPLPEDELPMWGSFMEFCRMFQIFEKALADAGDNPTRESFLEAMGRIGEFPMGTGSTGSFTPDKHEAPDALRPVRFDLSCPCWVEDGDWTEITFPVAP